MQKQAKISSQIIVDITQKRVKILNEEKPKCVQSHKGSFLARNRDKAEDPVWFCC